MTPIGSGFGRSSMFPPVIKWLLIINVGVLLLQTFFLPVVRIGGYSLADHFMRYFALMPVAGFVYPHSGVEVNFWPWQLFTYQFMHGGFWHLFFNMFALWMFGSELESLWGSKKFLFYYLLSGVGAGLAQLFIAPLFAPIAPTVGASGSVYGILIAFGYLFPKRPVLMFPFFIPVPARILVLIFIGLELIQGITGSTGIAHLAHLGGALTGFLLLRFGDKAGIFQWLDKIFTKKDPGGRGSYSGQFQQKQEPRIFRMRSERKPPEKEDEEQRRASSRTFTIGGEEITQDKIDQILDKINETGYQNLSEREKYILNELSKKL